MYIKCEHPQIILHPYTKERILKYGNYTIRGKSKYLTNFELSRLYNYFPSKLIHPKSLNIDESELDDCYVVSDDGELLPMYLYVPCGKCILCKSKKVSDWQCRALAECSTSTTKPLWLGLSYNPEFVPEHGVIKKDAQNFMKRLRIRLDRAGFQHELRYFLCSEYGEEDHRPHYHLILFNFPDMDDEKKYYIIREAWSRVVSLDEWSKFPEYSRFAKWKLLPEFDNPHYRKVVHDMFLNDMHHEMKPFCKSIRYHVRIGFIYYDSLDGADGIFRVKYCMKYMYKDTAVPIQVLGKYRLRKKISIPYNYDDAFFNCTYVKNVRLRIGQPIKVRLIRKKCNDTFYLASRKLAIGRQWFEENRKFHDSHINVIDVKFKSFGKVIEMAMPKYFKTLLFPSVSRLVPKEVRDKCKEFNQILFDRYKLSFAFTNKTVPLYRDELQLIKKFRCLNWFTDFAVHPNQRNMALNESALRFHHSDMQNKYKELFYFLKNVNIDSDYIINIQRKKDLFNKYLLDFINSQPQVPIPDLVNKLKKRRRSDKNKAKHLLIQEIVY